MIKKIFVLSALILGTVHFSFAQKTEVEEAVTKLTKLMVTPDSLALDKLILPDLSYGHSSGKIQTKARVFALVTFRRIRLCRY